MLLAHRRYFFILCAVFLVVWTALAISPNDRADWALENLLVVAFAGGLFALASVVADARSSGDFE